MGDEVPENYEQLQLDISHQGSKVRRSRHQQLEVQPNITSHLSINAYCAQKNPGVVTVAWPSNGCDHVIFERPTNPAVTA
ncbi:MAG: hypothetical protein CMQ05_04130 [Gammaproteobacteria bacterium]|nr:hypothetical protein [Gammaproteobacteria bacterium]